MENNTVLLTKKTASCGSYDVQIIYMFCHRGALYVTATLEVLATIFKFQERINFT